MLLAKKLGVPPSSNFTMKQLPVLPPISSATMTLNSSSPAVLELTYTAWDMRPFARDLGYEGEPFRWDPDRRAQLCAELDAYYAYLYGLSKKELRYILDPKDVMGEDYPSETFRVLKEKEIEATESTASTARSASSSRPTIASPTTAPSIPPASRTPSTSRSCARRSRQQVARAGAGADPPGS